MAIVGPQAVLACQYPPAGIHQPNIALTYHTNPVIPIKRIGGWSPNREDPGKLYLHLLEKIIKIFELDGILVPRNVQVKGEKHPRSLDYIA